MQETDPSLIGHWPLHTDTEDRTGRVSSTAGPGVEPGAPGPGGRPGTAARFDGRTPGIEAVLPDAGLPDAGEFTVSAWVCADPDAPDVIGDIAATFDPGTRAGMHLGIVSNSGVTSTATANHRSLHFGVSAAAGDGTWQDHGRPGNAVLVVALAAIDDGLYAGTLETGAGQCGHLWRYGGDGQWHDLGNPDGCNAVNSVAGFDGAVYCATGRYMTSGSCLGELLNTTPGGHVYRVEPDGRWVDCGHPGAEDATPEHVAVSGYSTGKADDAMALTLYRGRLYCTSNHRRGAFVYEGGRDWRYIGPDERILSFAVYRDGLYALINGGSVYRYESEARWQYCGRPPTSTQTYGGVISGGRFYVGTWPEGEVFRYDGGESWECIGRLGYSREIMAMAMYNGSVYAGALPMANVWRMDNERFAFAGNLDSAPAYLRRVWSMCVYGGRLFAGTLPSGRVKSLQAGRVATWDRAFPAGWHHVAGVCAPDHVALYVDGETVASCEDAAGPGAGSGPRTLRIGSGPYESFRGLISDVRVHARALAPAEVRALGGGSTE